MVWPTVVPRLQGAGPNEQIYRKEPITIMIWNYVLKSFAEQLNELNVDDYRITPVEKFVGS